MVEDAHSVGFWQRVETRFRPFGTVGVLEDSRLAARLPLFAGFGASLNIVVVAVYAFVSNEPSAGYVAVATAVLYLGSTTYYYLSGNARPALVVIIWASVANNLAMHIVLGGFLWSGMALGWGVVATTAAALFLGRTPTIAIGSTYLLSAVVLAFFESTLREGRTAPAIEVSVFLVANMFVVSLLLLVPMTFLLIQQISREQARANELLVNVLPEVVAARLKESPGVIADEFEECTVLFADIVGFTKHSSEVSPEQLVDELNHVFSRFDDLVRDHGAEKIKTIGDGYMVVAGAPVPSSDHVDCICSLALAMESEMDAVNDALGTTFQLRIGINTGSVVAGVIGVSRFSYDLWGDTVNVASRMESQGDPGRIQVTKAVAQSASDSYVFEPAGTLNVRGRGEMEVFNLVGPVGSTTRR